MSRSNMPRLWLALGNFHANQIQYSSSSSSLADMQKAVNAWSRGMQCGNAMETREGRLCALRYCSQRSEEERARSIEWEERWFEAVLHAHDPSFVQAEGMTIVRAILARYEESKQYQRGVQMCNQILSSNMNDTGVEEEIQQWRERLEGLMKIDVQESDSISMDCSD